jgi:hypothetical protein
VVGSCHSISQISQLHRTETLIPLKNDVISHLSFFSQAMVHVSSAYVNADRKYAEEVIYPAPGDPDKIIKMCQELAEKDLVKNASE